MSEGEWMKMIDEEDIDAVFQNKNRKVKIYQLEESTGQWHDMGNGYILINYSDKFDYLALIVYGEGDRKILLVSKVLPSGCYEKQGLIF